MFWKEVHSLSVMWGGGGRAVIWSQGTALLIYDWVTAVTSKGVWTVTHFFLQGSSIKQSKQTIKSNLEVNSLHILCEAPSCCWVCILLKVDASYSSLLTAVPAARPCLIWFIVITSCQKLERMYKTRYLIRAPLCTIVQWSGVHDKKVLFTLSFVFFIKFLSPDDSLDEMERAVPLSKRVDFSGLNMDGNIWDNVRAQLNKISTKV